MQAIIDLDIAASFRRFDRVQSATTARVCNAFLDLGGDGGGRTSTADRNLWRSRSEIRISCRGTVSLRTLESKVHRQVYDIRAILDLKLLREGVRLN